MSGTAWNTVEAKSESGDGAGAFELFFGYPDEAVYAAAVEQLVADEVASGIAGQDPTLWGPAAEDEAGKRLAWVDLPERSKALVTDISTLEVELRERGLSRIVLCGMGGSSLAPEVICAAAGVELVVLDSSDPDFVRAALEDRLAETVVVVSSKSGGTVETDSQRRAFEKAFGDVGIDPAERIVVVTDPGSPLAGLAEEAGYRTFLADPDVGGRYSALTAFGLVPSGLAGADVAGLLEQAAEMRGALEADSVDNPGLRLGGLLGVANAAGVDKLVLARRGLDVRRTRRLGRAADRGVHRQGGQGDPPGGGRLGRVPELLAEHTRRGPGDVRALSPSSGRSGPPPGSASPSTPPSAPSCCSGSTPPPSPAG